ncbi:n-terminal domain-like protein [Phaffia rhodozyma]|uniref:NAD(P)H-hydrate epimerase n=1 Tax=Phaffia rhodozyma TaxID=264483 RepID=A0A0F7SQK6_PHARH|nr:n-terminal domain-like protein [Phaffia rhodozyma]
MSEAGGFSLDQLMELAGLACATALARSFPSEKTVLVACGPGNQGGDGLVAARHLFHFGYRPTVYLPKPGKNAFYESLKKQCMNLHIPFVSSVDEFKHALNTHSVILDAIFGFSFKPPLREPFTEILPLLSQTKLPIISVDIPSGWDVTNGPIDHVPTFQPHTLLSLTAPKEGVKFFNGKVHYLGGRFVPPDIANDFELDLPAYPGSDQIVEIPILGVHKSA